MKKILIIALVALMFVSGCATDRAQKKTETIAEPPPQVAVLKSIEVTATEVKFTASGPFEYTIVTPSDPFKLTIIMNGISRGALEQSLTYEAGVVSEIKLTEQDRPEKGLVVDLTLSEPATLEPQYQSGVLTLTKKGADASQAEDLSQEASSEQEMVEEQPQEPMVPAQYIEDIQMQRRDNKVVVSLKADGSVYPEVFTLKDRLVIDIPNVAMRAQVPEEVPKPLRGIRWAEHADRTRVVLDLEPGAIFDVKAIGDTIEVSLATSEVAAETLFVEQQKQQVAGPAEEGTEKPEVTTAAATAPTKKAVARVSLDFQNADIVPIFRLLADVSGYNIVVDPKVKGKITMKLVNVPWDQALDLILKTHNLDKVIEGNVIRIAPAEKIQKEREMQAKLKAAQQKAEPLITKVFKISYADVNKVKSSIESAKLLSKRGNISVDERTGSLIVKDIESNIPKIANLIKTIDKPTPQVMIEARIVEVNTSVTKEFGIRWGITGQSPNRDMSITGLTPYMVDFPSGAGPGSGSGITFGFLNKAKTLGLDLEISALQTSGDLKIVSNPRIITLDNQEATISQGKSIPVRKLTSEGTVSTEFKDVKLELKVKPHITPDNSILLQVQATKEELDPTIPSVEGVPGTDKKEAKTNVLIKDGETIVIGGIYKTTYNNSEAGVPGLKDIPIIGWLFKNKRKQKTVNELLIFITPRIVTEQPK